MPGDARTIAHFMHRLAGRHEIALVYLARRMSRRWMRKLAPELALAEGSSPRRVDPLATESMGLPETTGQAVRLVTGVE